MKRAPWWAWAALAASTTLVGSYVGLSKLLVAVLPVFLLAWLRFGIAAVAMLPWLKRGSTGQRSPPRPPPARFWESFLGNFLFSICMLFGVKLSGAVAAGVVMAAIPAAVAVGSWWLLGERVGARVWAAVACAVLGVAMLALLRPGAGAAGDAAAASVSPWGTLLLLGAVVCEAAYVVIGKRLTAQLAPRRIQRPHQPVGAGARDAIRPVAAMQFDFAAVAASTWGPARLLLAGGEHGHRCGCGWRASRRCRPARSGVFMVMVPVSAAAVGVLLLGEPFGSGHAAAFALALAGLLLVTWPTGRFPRAVAAARSGESAR
ncbi:MAG: DMT family transporter [Rubrivivax sp.]